MAYNNGCQWSIKIKLLHSITVIHSGPGLQLISFLCCMVLFNLGNYHGHLLSLLIPRPVRCMPLWSCSSATWHCAVPDHSSPLFPTPALSLNNAPTLPTSALHPVLGRGDVMSTSVYCHMFLASYHTPSHG